MQAFDVGRNPAMRVGRGALVDIPDMVAAIGGGPVLIVADTVLAELGVTDRLAGILAGDGFDAVIAAEIAGEPKTALVDRLADAARQGGCRSVIAMGGGAAMDAGKLAAAIACGDAPARHYALSENPYPASRLPAIAVPTTAGTGSEVTRTAIVSSTEGHKHWYWAEELMFSHVVLDPELTVSLPRHITAWTGMDAIAHALEASTSRKSNAAGRLYGFQALEILSHALPRAVADAADIDARAQTLWGATVAGLALHNCNTHMGHNISHALGSLAPVHHGLATGLALEVTLPWLVAQPEGGAHYAAASRALGGPAEAAALPATLSSFMRSIAIPCALPAVCADVRPETLAEHMATPYNRGMAENAACTVTDEDLDRFAGQILSLPVLEQAA